LKVTIDSSEPLADALRVIGALYNVELPEGTSTSTDDASPGPGPGPATSNRPARSATVKASRRAPAKRSKTSSASRSARGRQSTGANSSEIRAWAVANGHAVSDRGTLPSRIKTDYAEAHKN